MKIRSGACALLLLTPAGTPVPALAQGPTIALEARAGYDRPTTDLGRTAILRAQGTVSFGRVEAGPRFGIAALARLDRMWGVRLSVDHAPDRDVRGVWACAPFVACPSVLIEPEGRVRTWTVGADVRLHPDIGEAPVRPVVFVGGGLRGHELRWTSPVEDVPIPRSFSDTNGFWRLGAGLSGDVGPVELFGEAEGTVGPFGAGEERSIEGTVPDGRNTNVDLGVVLGVRLTVR